jgi:DNA-binding transcriptional ArsR family regulator
MGIYELSQILDELAADPESLDQIMVAIKYDELKDIVMGEISELFRETTDEFMVTRIPHVDTYTVTALKYMCTSIMGGMTQTVNEIIIKKGPCEAVKYIRRFREHGMDDILLSEEETCINYGLSLYRNMLYFLNMVSKVTRDSNEQPCGPEDYHHRWKKIRPLSCADNIASLANPHRILILKMLNEGQRPFKDISATTGLRTGHLQFHLRALVEGGLLEKGEEKGFYGITKKGVTALNSLADFDRHMRLFHTLEE